MNKGKEPAIQQRPNPSNSRVSGDESPTSKSKKIFKLSTRGEASSPKNSPLKGTESFFPPALPRKISLSRQSNRAQSVEKLPPPINTDIKNKIVVTTKLISRESGMIRQSNKPVKVQESESRDHKMSKSASPNKERVVRELPKVKENSPKRDPLEVVSEENEDHFRETLQGLIRKDSTGQSKKAESPNRVQPIIAVETAWDEYNLNKGRNIMMQKKNEEEGKSPKREKKDLVIETYKPYGERDSEPGTPNSNNGEIKSASQIRGKFMKEHVLPEVRQKEQDQKKMMREYLDSQMDEKRRLKEEERLRQLEEDKKEEARLRREMDQLSRQYEKELNSSKGTKQTEIRTDSPLKELRSKQFIKREDSPGLKKLEFSDSLGDVKMSMKFKTLKETLKEESLLRKDVEEKMGELSGHDNIKKLAHENEQLRNQNLRKNELIDILITALKNTGQEGPISTDQHRYTPAFSQPRAKSRTVHEKSPVPARTVENVDSPISLKQDVERNNTSPWSTGGTYYAGLRTETDPDMNNDEPISPISTGQQTNTFRNSDNLSKLISPSVYPPELKLPAIPDFYSHRKGFSQLAEQNTSMKGLTFLSRSNMQTLETNASISQSSSRVFSTPINSKISPRQFSLNSPSSALILKPKSEIMTTSVTPTLYSRHITHYGRSKADGSPDMDHMSMGGRSTNEPESLKVISSLTQLTVRKGKESGLTAAFQVPGSPFRSSTNIHPRPIMDPRSPIRVVDMASGQQSTVNRVKGGNLERVEHKKSADEAKAVYAYPFMKDREPRFKDETISVREGVKSVRSLDQYLDKGDIEMEGEARKMDALKNRTKFPKDVFYLNLRKKV